MTPFVPTDRTLIGPAGSVWFRSAAHLFEVTGEEHVNQSERAEPIAVARWCPVATSALLLIGILLRLRMYLFNSSLWFDETLITLNILHRPFLDLVPPLAYHQGAPFGFLALEKAAVMAFGSSEYALRLVPLLAAVAALLLLYRLGRRILPAPATLAAVGLFALSVEQIGYSAEVKPYSMDTAVALLVALTAIEAASASRRRTLIGLALTGAAAVWFSYPAAFVLAGTGLCLAGAALRRRDWAAAAHLAAMGLVWTLSFAACYVVSMQSVARDTLVSDIWAHAYVPWQLSPWTAEWILGQNLGVFHAPVGITLSGLGVFTFIAGWTAGGEQGWKLRRWILLSPLAVAFAAAALHRYPYEGRFLNFAVPAIVVVISLGIARVAAATWRTAPVIGLSLIALMFLHPLLDGGHLAVRPTGREEIRPVLDYVRQHELAGDALYLYWRTEPAFTYYSERWKNNAGAPGAKVVHTASTSAVPLTTAAVRDRQAQEDMDGLEVMNWADRSVLFQKDLDALRGQTRVWVVFYHVKTQDALNEEQWFRDQLGHLGQERDRISMPGASAYLYELNTRSDHPTG